jgi:hypothetical protein
MWRIAVHSIECGRNHIKECEYLEKKRKKNERSLYAMRKGYGRRKN